MGWQQAALVEAGVVERLRNVTLRAEPRHHPVGDLTLVAWAPDCGRCPVPRGRSSRPRGWDEDRLQEALAWPAAAGGMQPAEVLAAELPAQPGAELLAH